MQHGNSIDFNVANALQYRLLSLGEVTVTVTV